MEFIEVLKYIVHRGIDVYMYCTDFIINLANIFGFSYYEVNFMIFCVVYPVLVVSLFLTYVVQRVRFKILNIGTN